MWRFVPTVDNGLVCASCARRVYSAWRFFVGNMSKLDVCEECADHA